MDLSSSDDSENVPFADHILGTSELATHNRSRGYHRTSFCVLQTLPKLFTKFHGDRCIINTFLRGVKLETTETPRKNIGKEWKEIKSMKIHWFLSILDDDVSRVGELSDLWRSPRGHRGHSGHHILARNVVRVVHTDPRGHRSLQTRFSGNSTKSTHIVHNPK